MKMKAKYLFPVFLSAIICSCTPAPHDNDDPEDTSPGVDEYFRVDINSYHWEEEDDETIGGILADFGSGPIYGLTATTHVDSSHFYYTVPYFYSNDTTWDLSSTHPDLALTFNTDSIYNGTLAGSLHIVRTNVGGIEVYTGTFNYTGLEIFHDSPATFANGEFVIARLL
jgi:hypothetical protein